MSLFQTLSGLLRDGEQVDFTLARLPDGRLRAVVQTRLGDPGESNDEAVAQVRAALAMPLIVTGTDAELDAGLAQAIGSFAERQSQVVETRDNLAAVSESTATARAAGERAATTKPARKAPKANTKPASRTQPAKRTSEPKPEAKDEVPAAAAPASTARMTNQLDLF